MYYIQGSPPKRTVINLLRVISYALNLRFWEMFLCERFLFSRSVRVKEMSAY